VRHELLRALGAALDRAADIGDRVIDVIRKVSDTAIKAAGPSKNAVQCPYCQEHVRVVTDHVLWCDLPATLEVALADSATKWPIVRCGFDFEREQAEALTRKNQ